LPNCATASLSCGANEACSDASGTAICVCAAGYQDNDTNGTCLPNCATAGLACGDNEICSDSSGTATCVCAAGYQDNDTNGTCLPNCATAGLACGDNEICSDSSGTATCVCVAGYQDNDDNGTCLPTCANSGLVCGDNGVCVDTSGVAQCDCDVGYSGVNCTGCEAGYQDNDANGTCEPTCATSGVTCNSRAQCSHASGTAQCVCKAPYTNPPECAQCAVGYVDQNADGICVEDCDTLAAQGYTCSDPNSECQINNDIASCVCNENYYKKFGICTGNCEASGWTCNEADSQGECVDGGGTTYASCQCEWGYQDNDDNGTCTESCESDPCVGAHELCEDDTGTVACVCEDGYVDLGSGCQEATCDPNPCENGTCDASSGVAVCTCDPGWQGYFCKIQQGKTCSAPIPINIPAPGVAIDYLGDNTGFGNDYLAVDAPGCSDLGDPDIFGLGEDVVYSFTLGPGEDRQVNFEVVEVLDSGLWEGIMYLRNGTCAATAEAQLACNYDIESPDPPWLPQFDVLLGEGTYFLIVDAWYEETKGPYTLRITTAP
jgi:Notch-like protein